VGGGGAGGRGQEIREGGRRGKGKKWEF